jgi:hypothetical protein
MSFLATSEVSEQLVTAIVSPLSPLTLIIETPSVIDSSWVIYTHIRDAVQKRKVDSITLLTSSSPRRAIALLNLSSATSANISIYGEENNDSGQQQQQQQQQQQTSQRSTTISLVPATPRVATIHIKIVDLSHSSFSHSGSFNTSKLIEALQPSASLKLTGGNHLIAIEDIGALIESCETLASVSYVLNRILHINVRNDSTILGPTTTTTTTTTTLSNTEKHSETLSTSTLNIIPISSTSSSSSSSSTSSASTSKHVSVHVTALCNTDADWAQSNIHQFSQNFGLGILENLALSAHYIIRIGPLPTGYSRDVHGRVSLEENATLISGISSTRPSYLGGSRSVLFRLSSDGKARAVGDIKFASLQGGSLNSKSSRNSSHSNYKEIPLSQDKFGEALVDD